MRNPTIGLACGHTFAGSEPCQSYRANEWGIPAEDGGSYDAYTSVYACDEHCLPAFAEAGMLTPQIQTWVEQEIACRSQC